MKVRIFGKESCSVCKSMLEKFNTFLKHWKIEDKVKLIYKSVDDVDGLTEAALADATEVPAIIIEKNGQELARWTGRGVESKEFKPYFEDMII